MRSVEEYLDQAAGFHARAALTTDPSLKEAYFELAANYKRLAAERKRLLEGGTITADE
jgi:hypothetical protein